MKHLLINRAVLITVLLCFFCLTGYGQRYHYRSYNSMHGSEKMMLKRSYFGFSLPVYKVDITENFFVDRSGLGKSGPSVDERFHTVAKSPFVPGLNKSIGMIGGSSFNIAKLSETSMIALDVASYVELTTIDVGVVKFSAVDSNKDDFVILNFGVPLTLMYKSGGEASLNTDNKLLFSIGAGIVPAVYGGTYGGVDGVYFKMRPYLVSEIGFVAGVGMKLRLAYFPGSTVLIDRTGRDIVGRDETTVIKMKAFSTGNTVLSLVFMIGVGHWD